MPLGLERRHNLGHLHFITFSCHHRLPYLETAEHKEILEQVIERTRRAHNFVLYAYVLMPEHLHLLLSEPKNHSLSSTMRVIKGESSKLLKGKRNHFWQPRYYDFNLFTTHKFKEKIQYIHRNPVKRGLVTNPEGYRWSSFNHYATGEPGPIEIESDWTHRRRERAALTRPSS
jgi:putative transposase